MFYRFSPPLDKFSLPMPEQRHYDVTRALIHGRRQRRAGIFKHGTNIVDRGLKVLYFGLYFVIFRSFFRCLLPLPWKRLNSAIFRYFLLIFGLFFVALPPWKMFCRRPCTHSVVIGVARVPTPGDKTIFASPTTKLQSLKCK